MLSTIGIIIDIVIVAVLVIFSLIGLKKGFLKSILALKLTYCNLHIKKTITKIIHFFVHFFVIVCDGTKIYSTFFNASSIGICLTFFICKKAITPYANIPVIAIRA